MRDTSTNRIVGFKENSSLPCLAPDVASCFFIPFSLLNCFYSPQCPLREGEEREETDICSNRKRWYSLSHGAISELALPSPDLGTVLGTLREHEGSESFTFNVSPTLLELAVLLGKSRYSWITKTWLLMSKPRWVTSKPSPHIKKIQFKERKKDTVSQWFGSVGLGFPWYEAVPSALWAWKRRETYLICIRYTAKSPASQFSTFAHWLRIEMSENWKAVDKKNIRDSQCGKSTEEEMTPFRGHVGTLLPLGLVQRLGVFTDSQKRKGPKIIHSKVLTSHLNCSFGRTWRCCFFCEMPSSV